jgi:predicted NBD/HSP70 family sugar kinase
MTATMSSLPTPSPAPSRSLLPEPSPASSPGDLLDLIRSGRAATRAELGRLTGLSRTAVTSRLAALISHGLVIDGEEGPSTGGRPAARLHFNRDAGVVLAGALGRSRSQLAVCDLDGLELAGVSHDQELGIGPDELMPEVARRFTVLLDQAGRSPADIRGVGLSIPGTVDLARGASLDSPAMTGWDGVALAPYLRELTGAPVFVDNDANVMALSERDGHLARLDDALLLKASTGFGLGIVADGRVIRGRHGGAGEIGHIKVAAAEGLPCRCGDVGCLEAIAGGWALVQQLRAGDGGQGRDVTHVRDLVALALRGDQEARGLLRESGRRTGEVVAAAVNLLNPQALVIGGDMAAAFDLFAAGLRETLYPRATTLSTRDLEIVPSTHGDRAGVVGCAALALSAVLSPAAVNALVSA